MVHDFPDTATFLSEQDRARVIRRLKMDQQSSAEHEEFKLTYLWAAVTDWKMYLGMVIYMGVDMPLYAFSLFLPTIIAELGFTSTKAQLLTVPVYACAAILTVTVGFLADRIKQRGIFNICLSLVGVIGFVMQLASEKAHVKYAGTFLGAFGTHSLFKHVLLKY
jgi:cyanate permease